MNSAKKLIELYSNKSKHSNYQVLPKKLRDIIQPDDIQTKTRYEEERLEYAKKKINFSDKSVLDIGANTGFFSFEVLDLGAAHVDYCEGNSEHAAFVETAVKALSLESRITVTNKYYNFDDIDEKKYDIVLLFNVLHHIGDDYGDKSLAVQEAKQKIAVHLNNMSSVCNEMIFQLGFNWQGDVAKPLFEKGTKEEQIEFVKNSTSDNWNVASIGIAVKENGNVMYRDVDDSNIERDDSLGEFLNRPIFILRSKTR